MTTTPEISAGVSPAYEQARPLGECAALADPALIRQHEDLLAWPAVISKWRELSWAERFGQEAPALPLYDGKPIGSPQLVPRATLDAAGDLDRDIRARLAAGHLRILAYQAPRQLDAEPVLLPVQLVASATVNWRLGTLGQVYIDRKAYETAKNEFGDYVEQAAEQVKRYGSKKPPKCNLEGRLTPGHLHARAQRYMFKRLLRKLWQAWREANEHVVSRKTLPPAEESNSCGQSKLDIQKRSAAGGAGQFRDESHGRHARAASSPD